MGRLTLLLSLLVALTTPAFADDKPYGYAVVYNKTARWAVIEGTRYWIGAGVEGILQESGAGAAGPVVAWLAALAPVPPSSAPNLPRWSVICCPYEQNVSPATFTGPVWEYAE